MTYVLPAYELHVIGVFDSGVPNQERIGLRPMQKVDLATYALVLGMTLPNGEFLPYDDSFFWFGTRIVEPPSWIFVYTGVGMDNESVLAATNEQVIVQYWNRQTTLFDPALSKSTHAALIKIGNLTPVPIHKPGVRPLQAAATSPLLGP